MSKCTVQIQIVAVVDVDVDAKDVSAALAEGDAIKVGESCLVSAVK